jgi:ribonuclease P protein component
MTERLQRRRDFVAAAKGRKISRPAFVLETRGRDDGGPPRFGFTVSRRVAMKAVERNRIRRRLKEAVRLGAADALPGHDYVLVGRRQALTADFETIRADLAAALAGRRDDPSRHGRARVPSLSR